MKKEETTSLSNNFGLASVILGIISITLFFTIFIPLLLGILGLIFGLIQRKKSKNKWGLWGIILSTLGIILGLLMIWLVYTWISNAQQLIQSCIANPNLPGCADILKYLQQGQLTNQYAQ